MSGQPHALATLHSGKEPLVPSEEEAGCALTASLFVTENRKIAGPCWDHPAT
jgi:hypothetical protein